MIKVTRRCLRALVMSEDPVLGTLCRRKMLTTDASLTDWGAILEGRSSQVMWKDHHLSWHINCLEMLAVFLALKNFLADLRDHHVLLHKSPGGFEVTSTLQTGLPNLPVVPREVVVSSSSLHPGGPRYRSRHPVETGAEVREIEAPPRGGGADIEGVRPYTSRSVCRERRLTFHSGSPSRIQLLSDWTQWCRRGQGFVCMHFPRSICSRESWRKFAGTGFYYFSLPRGGRAEYGSRIFYLFLFILFSQLADAFIQSDLQMRTV